VNTRDRIASYVKALRAGEDVSECLQDVGEAAAPALIAAFNEESDRQIRREIVEIIWQYRSPANVPFLAGCLRDHDDEVRQQAIDGLISLGIPEARKALTTALERCRSGPQVEQDFAEYLAEAIESMDKQPPVTGE
jgi:HEAT repeat protein